MKVYFHKTTPKLFVYSVGVENVLWSENHKNLKHSEPWAKPRETSSG